MHYPIEERDLANIVAELADVVVRNLSSEDRQKMRENPQELHDLRHSLHCALAMEFFIVTWENPIDACED
jgi:hypothetical protein